MGTHYDTLGLASDATAEEIEDQYRELAKVVHPDVGGDAVMFMVLNEAYEVLSDPSQRAAYDRSIRASQSPSADAPSVVSGMAHPRGSTPEQRARGLELAKRGILSWHQTADVRAKVGLRQLKQKLMMAVVVAAIILVAKFILG